MLISLRTRFKKNRKKEDFFFPWCVRDLYFWLDYKKSPVVENNSVISHVVDIANVSRNEIFSKIGGGQVLMTEKGFSFKNAGLKGNRLCQMVYGTFFFILRPAVEANMKFFDTYSTGGSTIFGIAPAGTNSSYNEIFTPSYNFFSSNSGEIGINSFKLITIIISLTSPRHTVRINRSTVREDNFTGTPSPGGNIIISGFNDSAFSFDGTICSAIGYNRVLTQDEINFIEENLMTEIVTL